MRNSSTARYWNLLLFTSLGLLAARASAETRDRVLEWRPPSGPVSGYLVHLGNAPSTYGQVIDLGAVPTDSDGVGRSTLTLDATREYFVAMSAYNDAGDSPLSNEIKVGASQCNVSACDDGLTCTADDCTLLACTHKALPDGTLCNSAAAPNGMCQAGSCRLPPSEPSPPAVERWVNADVDLVYAKGNSCGGDYQSLAYRCAAWLLEREGLSFNTAVIEDSVQRANFQQSFSSNSTGTPLANLIFDLGGRGAANAIVFWQFVGGRRADAQVRGYEIRTSDQLGADRRSLKAPVTVAKGTLRAGSSDLTGQRVDELSLGRFVQIVGTSNYGNPRMNALGRVGFVRR